MKKGGTFRLFPFRQTCSPHVAEPAISWLWALPYKSGKSRKARKMMRERIGIKACGYSVPPHVRDNNDPIFDTIKRTANAQGVAEVDLFTGMEQRRYLLEQEQVESHMVEASSQALANARL